MASTCRPNCPCTIFGSERPACMPVSSGTNSFLRKRGTYITFRFIAVRFRVTRSGWAVYFSATRQPKKLGSYRQCTVLLSCPKAAPISRLYYRGGATHFLSYYQQGSSPMSPRHFRTPIARVYTNVVASTTIKEQKLTISWCVLPF